ncbi:uncharacterized protein LOC131941445 [Physella acuta]|uniref:uncharacterized protein LOC131941445 n=1 Tax=Physella acuta TaxID=109671 RepID=UPI0027DE1638|nr:uncharacterized protein LOC131941445 [Physella acuta]
MATMSKTFICDLDSGTWNVEFTESHRHCDEDDKMAPDFPDGCLDNEELKLLKMRPYFYFPKEFQMPEVTDSSKVKSVQVAPTPFFLNQHGVNTITITATDEHDNSRSCQFYVVITEAECTEPCIGADVTYQLIGAAGDYVNYKLSCPHGEELVGQDILMCWGDHSPPYQTRFWNSVDRAKCSGPCKLPTVPGNVYMVFHNFEMDVFYEAYCKEGYMTPRGVPQYAIYHCERGVDEYRYDFIPNCVADRYPDYFTIKVKFVVQTPDCLLDLVEAGKAFNASLHATNWTLLCGSSVGCTPDVTRLYCLNGTTWEHIYVFGITLWMEPFNVSRGHLYRRIIENFCDHIEETSELLFPKFIGKSPRKILLECEDIYTCTIPGTLMDRNYILPRCVGCGEGHIYNTSSDECEICPKDFYQDQEIAFSCIPCPPGLITRRMAGSSVSDCKAGCGKGSFYDRSRNLCPKCPLNTYQDKDVAEKCQPCPGTSITLKVGSTAREACIALCKPGHFSLSRAEPCRPCPVGSYQTHAGKTTCDYCPFGMRTTSTPSISATDCTFFDVRLREEGPDAVIQGLQQLPVRFTWMSWISPVWFHMTSGFRMSLGTRLNTSNLNAAFLTLDNLLLMVETGNLPHIVRRWNHVAVTYQNNKAVLFVNGEEEGWLDNISLENLNTKKIIFRKSYTIKSIWINGMQMSQTVLTKSQLQDFATSCYKQLDENLLRGPTSLPVLLLTKSCNATNVCTPTTCGPHATCFSEADGYRCQCKDPWTGTNCDHQVVQCNPITSYSYEWGDWDNNCTQCVETCFKSRSRKTIIFAQVLGRNDEEGKDAEIAIKVRKQIF